MKPENRLRVGGIAIGCAALGIAAVAFADTPTPKQQSIRPTGTQSAAPRIPVKVTTHRARFGDLFKVHGRVPANQAGRKLILELRTADHSWKTVGETTVGKHGKYEFRTRATASGTLRVSWHPSAAANTATPVHAGSSAESRIHVRTRILVNRQSLDVLAGRPIAVTGRIRPGVANVPMRLQIQRKGRWQTLTQGRSRRGGHFHLRVKANSAIGGPIRVTAHSVPAVADGRRRLGRAKAYRTEVASWYGAGFFGNKTACGQTYSAGLHGVAHKTLACGTPVAIHHNGRAIRTRVIDRGPYVRGRSWDLSAATARALGFNGVGAIKVSY